MGNEPIFVIHGSERRKLKKEYNKLKSFIKGFWYWHQMDKDMCTFYDCHTDTYPMPDDKAQKLYDEKQSELLDLEKRLAEKLT